MQLKIDPEFKEQIPELSKDEYRLLEKNIQDEGCRESLVIWAGQDILLDGHNRYEICNRHNIDYEIKEVDLPDREAVQDWIDANQLGRRNLSPDNFRLILGRLYNRKKKQPAGREDRDFSGGQIDPPKTAQKLAEQHGVGEKTVKRAGKFAETVDEVKKTEPEVVAKGEQEILKKAKELNKQKKEENKKIRQERELEQNKELTSKAAKVIQADYMTIIEEIEDIDLLIADPPYFTDGDFTSYVSACLKKVKLTGQAYVFAGADPKELLAYLSINPHHMLLEQILVWNYNNTGQRQPNQRYTSNYQVCFYYRGPEALNINKPADGKHQYACQTVNAPDARIGDRYFKWQKPIELIDRLIRNSSKEGDFVFDPFVGCGTTVLSAAKLGRKNLGCDINAERIKECKQRGCEVEKFI